MSLGTLHFTEQPKIDRKVHLAVVDFAISGWPHEMNTVCGKTVRDAVMIFMWDQLPMGTWLDAWNSLSSCQECWGKVVQADIQEACNYVYGVKSAAAMKVIGE